jgi:hypothetical protein
MLLSALTFAAMLQAAPDLGLNSLRAPRLADGSRPVGELAMPLLPKARRAAVEEARAKAIRPAFVRKPRARAPLLPNPHIAGCNPPPQYAANPDRLPLQPLSKLPKAHGERAVSRLVDGCAAPVMIEQGPIER